eukprot:CAMPEP_0194440326 /NCGR_PEP_ID=MMETSP0176-20130528/115227_1 /TAXON_ID=216777 /ORGANISM="Proboscia alata, Strain PI-D3" /LENGTH=118 /DNA_ID=CAMNT_0039264455 /DNA_START=435 /DNA_END=791 /DNA_ORIENTATION=-
MSMLHIRAVTKPPTASSARSQASHATVEIFTTPVAVSPMSMARMKGSLTFTPTCSTEMELPRRTPLAKSVQIRCVRSDNAWDVVRGIPSMPMRIVGPVPNTAGNSAPCGEFWWGLSYT